MNITPAQVTAGQAAFTRLTLPLYDFFTLALVCRFAWRCPNSTVLAFYQHHLSANHLEVGVGTGYFLDHCRFPVAQPRLALLDLNPHCLTHTAKRVARYRPEIHRASVLEPVVLNTAKFDSVALNYVLHCLPGSLPGKGIAFGHLKALLNPGGKLFGATVLQHGVSHNVAANMALAQLNARQVFCNRQDTLAGLREALHQHLRDVQIEVHGSVALFVGTI